MKVTVAEDLVSASLFVQALKVCGSPLTSNSNVGPFGAYSGPIFCSKDPSTLTRSWGLSKISSEVCEVSIGKALLLIRIFDSREKIWPTSSCEFFSRRMSRSPLLFLLEPSNCFFTVLRTADRTACFKVFFSDATSSNSGMLCDKNSLPIGKQKLFGKW